MYVINIAYSFVKAPSVGSGLTILLRVLSIAKYYYVNVRLCVDFCSVLYPEFSRQEAKISQAFAHYLRNFLRDG